MVCMMQLMFTLQLKALHLVVALRVAGSLQNTHATVYVSQPHRAVRTA